MSIEKYIVIFKDGARGHVLAEGQEAAEVEAVKLGNPFSDVIKQSLISARVGDPASYHIGSDTYGGKIVAVSRTGHRVTWQRVGAHGVPFGNFVHECSRRRDGGYRPIGRNWGKLELGISRTNLDPGL